MTEKNTKSTKKPTKKQIVENDVDIPKAFAQDMGTMLIRHWKFFVGFALGAGVAIYFL